MNSKSSQYPKFNINQKVIKNCAEKLNNIKSYRSILVLQKIFWQTLTFLYQFYLQIKNKPCNMTEVIDKKILDEINKN